MTGVRKRSTLDDVVHLLFVVFAALAVNFLVVSWAGLFPASYALDGGTTGAAAFFLLAHRLRSYRRNHSALGAVAYALADIVVFVGVMAAAAWVFVFPLVHPLPSDTVAVGVISLVLISAMVVVLRFVQPITRAAPDRDYSDIESSIRKLEVAVTRLGSRMPEGESNGDSATLDRLSTLMSELEAMRKEFATIRSSVPPQGSRPSTVVYGAAGVRAAPGFPSGGEQVAVVRPPGGAANPQPAAAGPPVPESTVNNPWLDVLARRRTKRAPDNPSEPGQDQGPDQAATQ